jgi:hypothetical protein
MEILQMRIACWIPEATNTHSQYVILIAFPLQQWLYQCASLLHYTYIACIVLNRNIITFPKKATFWISSCHTVVTISTVCVWKKMSRPDWHKYYSLDFVHCLIFNKARFGIMPCFHLQTRKAPNLVDPLHGGQSPPPPQKRKIMCYTMDRATEPSRVEVHVSSTLSCWRNFDLWSKDATKVQKWPQYHKSSVLPYYSLSLSLSLSFFSVSNSTKSSISQIIRVCSDKSVWNSAVMIRTGETLSGAI